ncbi:hypothetical protein [Methylosinus sporium]|uniref:DUF2946 domain-containing protein n=1 Tax=Methylosinus sporium TaxID=428 RepID=A0A2U1SSM2_METSR|nr:hypothetical protein [Methylosinus sporium]PWB94614.1 hypothetical protein C5689_05975 [Methylosinus sporium]
MRRNLASILLFSLALAVQAIAPATAGLARSALAPGQICAAFADSKAAPSVVPAGHAEAGPELCDLCALCCGVAAPLAASPEIARIASPGWTWAEWAATVRRAAIFEPDHARRARAPPLSI